jgi:phosphoribosyl-ATP pyrophosphohydrolase/phosphoribosyl-AMP cyclohydrolase
VNDQAERALSEQEGLGPEARAWLERVVFDGRGLALVVAQDVASGAILMVAWANRAALERTIATGEAWFWSRRRGALWKKGETSGNVLRVHELRLDCDGDVVCYRATPTGPVCHTGTPTCFDAGSALVLDPERPDPSAGQPVPARLWATVLDRQRARPAGSYVVRLLDAGTARIARKVGEEAVETVVAALGDDRHALVAELADLWFHTLVLLADRGLSPADVRAELERRHLERAPAPSADE